ncbi:DEKNAAC100314 [Brettanomyces naardenensis]|uniref:DEKNAAC100314 n=1 Tax=Brettanomyces naardenensis TaxID=13370 RepID=A0A448YEQ1_BRENA|nr:DEKNAAC100314 [Brettanomyces naardenensis]
MSGNSSSETPTRSKLALKGDSKIVADFFEYSIHSILYQRGIYPANDFKVVRKYGLNMLVSMDDEVVSYIYRIMKQLRRWIYSGIISKLVIDIVSKETGEVVERWQFDLQVHKTHEDRGEGSPESKSKAEVQKEIQSIIRQITASVTFLPELQGENTFNVLVFADPNCKVPVEWGDSDAKEIHGDSVENVRFRSFSTDNHSVSAYVTYRISE